MPRMLLKAYAKLNLALDVVSARSDGYHEMDMLMQSVSCCDFITLETQSHGVTLSCTRAEIPCDQRNIAWKAAELFLERAGVLGGVSIHIEKHIPEQAGMAGGSADAAAVLIGLNQLYDGGFSLEELCGMGKSLGADVPFCLTGGTAHVTGIGEKIFPLSPLPDCAFIIAKPMQGISTKAAFEAIDSVQPLQHVSLDRILSAAERSDLPGVCAELGNSFEQVTQLPEVFEIKRKLVNLGACGALMSGSGSAVFGIFLDDSLAASALDQLKGDYPDAVIAKPVRTGVEPVL